jgi:Prokaryotic E2 family E
MNAVDYSGEIMQCDYLRDRWIEDEVLQLALRFGEIDFDERAKSWIMLPRFPIAPRLGRASCAVLIKLPAAYPSVPPYGVFIDRDLELDDHYYPESGGFNQHADQGWAWLCLHPHAKDTTAWQPGRSVAEGDNLLILLVLVRAMLDEHARRIWS